MNRQVRVGLVVVLGLLLFTLAIFGVASQTFLFSDRFLVRSHFSNVAGLRAGADVQFQGFSVGVVSSVSLPDSTGGQIEVTMGITESAHHLIHENTQAQIKTEGLLGSMIVVLVNPVIPQDASAPRPIRHGGTIPGIDPFDLFEITDKALESVQRFEQSATSFERIIEDIRNGEGTLGKLVYDPALYNSMVATANETQRLMTSVGNNAEALVDLAEQATHGVGSVLSKLDEGEGTLAQLLNDPGVYDRVLSTADTLQAVTASLHALLAIGEDMANWGVIGAFRFAELMEAGKHNWLFKRYFEERGYLEQAPFEIREKAIQESFLRLHEKERELELWEARLEAWEAAALERGNE